MSDIRLEVALTQGLIPAPGDLSTLVIGASADSALATAFDTAQFVQPLQPDHDALAARGLSVSPDLPEGHAFDMVIVVVPRARARAQGWAAAAAAALKPGGLLVLDGAKTDGIDSLYRALRGRLTGTDTLTKAHGRMFWGRPGADLLTDLAPRPATPDGFQTGPGVFSADGVDPGSAALAAALPPKLPRRIADLGAGWGWLSAQILTHEGVETLDLVESDHIALTAARANVTDPRARFVWADALAWRPDAPLDAVVMNPPFHTGRAGDPKLGQAFITAAARVLGPQGQLWLVANRHLPYEATLEARFRDVEALTGTSAFKILHASRPIQTRKEPGR
jgi:16S rRNA (guanine1207-N2)-methyltransferase